jgi:hypothetical protein
MEAQTFMLIECPRCFAMMRCRAKFCRRCGQELAAATPPAAAEGISKAAFAKPRIRRSKILCCVGTLLLLSAFTHRSAEKFALGVLMFAAPGREIFSNGLSEKDQKCFTC